MAELTIDIQDVQGVSGTAIVTLNGSIDARTVISFKTQIESAKGRGLRTFVMDLDKISYINSTGLSYLISLADSGDPNRPGLVLLKIQAKVKVLFDMMGLGPLFKFAYTQEEAFQSIGVQAPKSAFRLEPAAPPPPPPPPVPVETKTPSPAPLPLPPEKPAATPREKTPSTFLPPPPLPAAPPPPREKTPLHVTPSVPIPPVRTATPSPIHIPPPEAPKTAPLPVLPGPATARLAPPPTVRAMPEPTLIRPARHEDWLAVGLAFLIVGISAAGLRPPMASFRWASDGDFFSAAAGCKPRIDRLAEQAEDGALAAAATAVRRAYEKGDRAGSADAFRALAEAAAKSRHEDLRSAAVSLDREAGSLAAPAIAQVFSQRNLLHAALTGIVLLILAGIAAALMGGRIDAYAMGFPLLFSLAWLAQVIAGNLPNGRWGVDAYLAATLLGLLVANSVGVPAWMRESLRSEFYLKTGLVLMGASFILPSILRGSPLVLVQGAVVTIVVGLAGYWIARLFRVDEDFSAILSATAAIGGIPAAIGAFLSVKGDRRKLPYVVGLVFIVSLALILLMPWVARSFRLSDAVGGAWLGGTIDSPAGVATAGARVGEPSESRAVSAKASQDAVLLLAVLVLSVIWARRHASRLRAAPGAPSFWGVFPKSILGFLAVSLAFSFAIPPATAGPALDVVAGLRDTVLALAFVSIGLETRFADMVRMERGRPAAAFILAQAVNALCALGLAMLLFGGSAPAGR
jgi:anti-anti-sigma factor